MIEKKIKSNAHKVDKFLINYLKKQKKTSLVNPMKYGVLYGGKKIRSSIILSLGNLFKVPQKKLLYLCAAVECVHSYSLIHDDLPCMDNDKIRRGKPTTHIKYGESTAILAGSSLLTLAFEILSNFNLKANQHQKNKIINYLALCSGHLGIAGGQELDLKFEHKKKSIKQVIEMQKKKTGKLFSFCFYTVAILANKKKEEINKFDKLGEDIGLLFQISDDFLDKNGDRKKMGKPTKKDNKKGKSTLISLMGYNKSQNFAKNLEKRILSNIGKHGKRADELKKIIFFILDRKY